MNASNKFLIRKEVALGTLRELLPPQDHIGLTQIAPFKDVGAECKVEGV